MIYYLRKRIVFAFVAATISDAYSKIRLVQLEKHLQGSVIYAIISGIVAVSLMAVAHIALYLLQKELTNPLYRRWRICLIAYHILFAIGSIAHVVKMF